MNRKGFISVKCVRICRLLFFYTKGFEKMASCHYYLVSLIACKGEINIYLNNVQPKSNEKYNNKTKQK